MLRALLLALLLSATVRADEGVLPVGADGKPLNLDFETGTLKDWTLEGEAFKQQPIKGDTVSPRRNDMKSEHQGQFWIGGYEKLGDKPQGTLTSASFKVTHPWASFLVGGGPHKVTGVELVRKDTGKVFYSTSGVEEENLKRAVVDLRQMQGEEIFIRIVDQHTGHWGHVNFDDFRFHKDRPQVPARVMATLPDEYPHAGLPPLDAAKAMTVPKGFEVKLFAGEPDLHQPIAMCTDDRGRLWVVEAYVYPRRKADPGVFLKDPKLGDKILIFEDSDNDGKFDKRTVFLEGLNLVSGIEFGFGGLWVGAAPYFMFIPIQEGDKAGEPKILLDGWGYQDTHETLNSFIWGPDGWLYGCHGVFTHSRVGKPNTPDDQRTPINAGIWRYHPTKHLFEVFAHGTSNPWGLDYNEYGDWFIEACVIPHNWHIIQGGRYQRQAGTHFNPFTFDDIKTIAEHRHYVGNVPHGGNGRSDSAGGGHAHSGTLIYQGGLWPKEFHGKMLMGNIHGHRVNIDTLTAKGSGYVASRHPDFMLTHDKSSLLISIHPAPDGNIYLLDWYDKQSCHRNEPEIWDRTNGRIYKVTSGPKLPAIKDLSKLSSAELSELQRSKNVWEVRHARRILHERLSIEDNLKDYKSAVLPVWQSLMRDADEKIRLRGIWLKHTFNRLSSDEMLTFLSDPNPQVRGEAIRLAGEGPINGKLLAKLVQIAERDESAVVRRGLATLLQKQPLATRFEIAEKLLTHPEDAADHNLPLLYWYGIEPLGKENPKKALELVTRGKLPMLVQFMARRIAITADEKTNEELVVALVLASEAGKSDIVLSLLRGMNEGFKGRRDLPTAESWMQFYPVRAAKLNHPEILQLGETISIQYRDRRIIERFVERITEPAADVDSKLKAIETLLDINYRELAPPLQKALKIPALRGAALRGLAKYDDAETPKAILSLWKEFSLSEKRDAATTLASRPAYAKVLLESIGKGEIKPTEIPSDLVRLMRNLPDASVAEQITKVWGVVRDTPADRIKTITEWRKKLAALTSVDLSLGRAVYQKTCAQCHTLYGIGGNVGPDITGANRSNLDYLLENIFDPSAVIPNDYKMSTLVLTNGQTLQGIVQGEANNLLTVQTATEKKQIPKVDIESVKPSNISMMPEDVLKPLSETEIRALFGYLKHTSQVPMLLTSENAKEFFNGEDLKFWDGDTTLWKVENREIVGKTTTGLKKNNFLKSHFTAENFKLALKVKLIPNKENSGIQFRSEPFGEHEMKGYQADIGAGWWGKLYEESGRALLWKESGEQHVKVEDWNEYVIVAEGSKIKTFINGKACVDLDDPKGDRRGIFAVQIHSGGPMEVRFKDLKLEWLGKVQ